MPYSVGDFGNPHSRTHAYGWDSEAAMENARKVCGIAKFPFDLPVLESTMVVKCIDIFTVYI